MSATCYGVAPMAAQFAVSLFWIYVAYSDWNAATYVAEELRRPARTLPMALAVGTMLVAALYIGLNLVFIYAVPLEKMKGEVWSGRWRRQACSDGAWGFAQEGANVAINYPSGPAQAQEGNFAAGLRGRQQRRVQEHDRRGGRR